MTQTTLSLILLYVPILLLPLEVGDLRDSVYSPSVLPEVFISSFPFHFQQFGYKEYGCSMHEIWEVVRQWRATGDRQGCAILQGTFSF